MEELRRLAESTSEGAAGESPSNIMVVDDQPANLKLLEDLLTQQGYAVRSFPRGRLALDAAARNLPDLILLDINMPEMNGFEVCERLKADAKLAPVPVLFLSALNETKDKLNAFRSGGVDYITKPFQLEEVRARVETHLQLHRARQSGARASGKNSQRRGQGAVRSCAPDVAHLDGAVGRAVRHGGSHGRAIAPGGCLAV